MATTSERDLRRLAKRFNIKFIPPGRSDDLPSQHIDALNQINQIREQKLKEFHTTIENDPRETEWRERTKLHAQRISERAVELSKQAPNEAGWRFELENLIFRRFTTEAAWHETDAKRIFDNRAQEVVLHHELLRSELPKQAPDRVFGLRKTDSFEKILEGSLSSGEDGAEGVLQTLEDTISTSPFKDGTDSLLFPFMILEAKSGRSSNGFDDIQLQTAFPILALLKLQHDLTNKVTSLNMRMRPLVWFFAHRGEAWRVYVCYTTQHDPIEYHIAHLWDGCIQSEDDALRLLLIVDSVFKWARDLYRPSILKQLTCLTNRGTDDVTVPSSDSNFASLQISNEDSKPESPDNADQADLTPPPVSDSEVPEQTTAIDLSIPNTKFGTLRSASRSTLRVTGLLITDDNVRGFLELFRSGCELTAFKRIRGVARSILNMLSERATDLLTLSASDIDYLESGWVDRAEGRAPVPSSTKSSLALIEYSTYISSSSWNITRELAYLAVSEAAVPVLLEYADFKRKQSAETFLRDWRHCNGELLDETIECLRSGSPGQLLMDALSCTKLRLAPLPKRKRVDFLPPVSAITFEQIRKSPLKSLILQSHKLRRKKIGQNLPEPYRSLKMRYPQQPTQYPEPAQLSFIRNSECTYFTPKHNLHDEVLCERCRRNRTHAELPGDIRRIKNIDPPACGMVLVESIDLMAQDGIASRHDLCLFAFDTVPVTALGLSVYIESLFRGPNLYHTIRHPIPQKAYRKLVVETDVLWNLPCPCRPFTRKQRQDTREWICELSGREKIIGKPIVEDSWSRLQILLYFLLTGRQYEIIKPSVIMMCEKDLQREQIFRMVQPALATLNKSGA